MSDYIDGLRADLVEAAARHQSRGALVRTLRPVRPRAWSRPAIAATAAALACAAAVLVAVSALRPPSPAPTRPHAVVTVKVTAIANDATLAAGDLWVADLNEGVVRVDASTGRRIGATPVAGNNRSVNAAEGSVWLLNESPGRHPRALRIDPRSGRVVARYAVDPSGAQIIAAGASGLWLPAGAELVAMQRIDPTSRERTARVASASGQYPVSVAATPEALWLVMNDGTLVEVDAATGRLAHSLPRAVTGSHGNGANDFPASGLAVGADGAWVADHERGTVVHVVGGRIVQRIRAGVSTGAVAVAGASVWVTTADALNRRFRVVRIDPAAGKVTGSVDLSYHAPKALVPTAHGLWVVASDGTALLVR